MAYDHKAIDGEIRAEWKKQKLYETDLSDPQKPPYYLLTEFPYPSGDLHTGHWYAFAVADIYARLLRMRSNNVLYPIGFDAFGLPAENAAIKHGVDPREWTYKNIERMRSQLESMGASFDWSKEIIACDPSYYQWTQWLFTQLFEHNLAEHKEAAVKWCPKDQTVLANEQVVDGHCERCGTEVEEKILTQWFLKITDYAERLLAGLDTLPWREDIKEGQRAWIGKSEGASLEFDLIFKKTPEDNAWRDEAGKPAHLTVFTTRPDTVFGATYVVIAPDHPWMTLAYEKHRAALLNPEEIAVYLESAKKKTERERSENKDKTGVELKGIVAVNPATKEEIPIYVADYVLGSYGTGAVMAVPAHDERDYAFASKENIPIRVVISPESFMFQSGNNPQSAEHLAAEDTEISKYLSGQKCYTGEGTLLNSGPFTGRGNREAMWDIVTAVRGTRTTNYRLRDWLVSRQRYWGCPIPIVYDPSGKPHSIPKEHLPWLLPTDVDFTPTGESPLASSVELRDRVTRIFGEGWTPEFDTLDTFVDSSWYFLRYLAPHDAHHFSEEALMKKWLPVDRYAGGAEHTTMHLLYARFFTHALYDLALVPVKEPFRERFNRGLIIGLDGHKMSKSKGNVINPDEFVQQYGADAVRLYLAFIGPYNEPGNYPWSLEGVSAMRKFIDRIDRLVDRAERTGDISLALKEAIAEANIKVVQDSDRFKLNTAVSALMVLVNAFEGAPTFSYEALRELSILLAPFAPHFAEYVWSRLGETGSVHSALWPAATAPLRSEVELVIQINGKRKESIRVQKDISEEMAYEAATSIPRVQELLAGQVPKRIIYVPGKIINLVLG